MSQKEDAYNKGGLIAFLFTMVFSLVFFIWVAIIYPGVNLKEVPDAQSTTEQTVAGEAAAVDVSNVENPWVSSEALVARGQKVYQANCAVCHGDTGKGDGIAGKSLVPPPRDLVAGKWTVGGDSISLFNTVTKGIEGTSMAAFGHIPKVDRWAIVHFIHSITNNNVETDSAKLEAFGKTAE